ncbi:MAG TPA: calcium/sodium antiporter [Bacteroidetes bacterium]|nr:calcium/sodium antiporter [Bacteroidota bacterium]
MGDLFSLILGLVLLLFSGEFLVRGGTSLARNFRVSNLVIGVTVVSLGTSAPELVVSIDAALTGHPAISIGNVIGSNISNMALILGLVALILPIPVNRDSIRYDWPVMMLASVLFFLFILNGWLQRWEGILFFLSLIGFVSWSIIRSRKENHHRKVKLPPAGYPVWLSFLLVAVSSLGLVFGANQLVNGASGIALRLGVSEHAISVTVVALGTSLPELATSLVAAIRKEMDISVGNIIGSNIFNLFGILGLTATVKPIHIAHDVIPDVMWMLGLSVLLLLFMLPFRNGKIRRWEGLVFLVCYAIYVYLVFIR